MQASKTGKCDRISPHKPHLAALNIFQYTLKLLIAAVGFWQRQWVKCYIWAPWPDEGAEISLFLQLEISRDVKNGHVGLGRNRFFWKTLTPDISAIAGLPEKKWGNVLLEPAAPMLKMFVCEIGHLEIFRKLFLETNFLRRQLSLDIIFPGRPWTRRSWQGKQE